MRGPFVKVCGITRLQDAQAAVAAGARAVGFVFVEGSPRRVTAVQARAIGAALPPGVARVGVVASWPAERVRDLVAAAGLSTVQAHGEETPEECRSYGVPVVKAVRAGVGFSPAGLEPYREFPILFDALTAGALGGTGRRADWDTARRAREAGFRILLAGGLGPDNVGDAVLAVEPVAVDLNSGVEAAPGVKDPERIRAAMAALAVFEPPEETSWPW